MDTKRKNAMDMDTKRFLKSISISIGEPYRQPTFSSDRRKPSINDFGHVTLFLHNPCMNVEGAYPRSPIEGCVKI